ncbi:MAG: M3 family oligoendopeptidase [Armatimonadetes bacterium]|nr:M3 family oligoendopeptidase [Armatimonadota bacterium]MDE2207811.1 M3 family oligoendopeptidase [Armatimonadota bacterium]
MTVADLPRWDLTPFFPSLDSSEFRQALDSAEAEIRAMQVLFDKHNVRRRTESEVDTALVTAWEDVTTALNGTLEEVHLLEAYLACLVTTNAKDEIAQSFESRLETAAQPLQQLMTRYTAWCGTTDIDELQKRSPLAAQYGYLLSRAQQLAGHQMSESEEALAVDLRSSGLAAWGALHGKMSALLSAPVDAGKGVEQLPLSAVRALAADADRAVRQRAWEAEQVAWESVSVPLAAALNGIKGWQQTLRARRSFGSDVEPTLIANGIDAITLEAMQAACIESFPDFHRYLRAKAKWLGVPVLAWWDISAPVGKEARIWGWAEASEFVASSFNRYSARLGDFATAAFRDEWVDAGPRLGKEGGAYCMGLSPGVSRVLMNFSGSFTDVSTLAHELGHAYHNLNLGKHAILQRRTPSTLAETASIFCETLTFDGALQGASSDDTIVLLDTVLQRNLQVVVDIHSRFLFERGVFQRRAQRNLTVTELCDLMTECQRAAYDSAVDPLHPWMWAVKGHYYGPTFYNYPYTYGLLFGLGLYSLYRNSSDTFKPQYDDLLASTGTADAVSLAARFGIDVTSTSFWRASLDIIRGQIAEFESAVAAAGK